MFAIEICWAVESWVSVDMCKWCNHMNQCIVELRKADVMLEWVVVVVVAVVVVVVVVVAGRDGDPNKTHAAPASFTLKDSGGPCTLIEPNPWTFFNDLVLKCCYLGCLLSFAEASGVNKSRKKQFFQ